MSKKSQSAVEFIILIGAVLFMFISFTIAFQVNLTEKTIQKRNLAFNELGKTVKNEIDIAATASDGYERTFNIPEKVFNIDYTIIINSGLVQIESEDSRHALALPIQNVTGQLQKGDNIIKKQNGEILLNN